MRISPADIKLIGISAKQLFQIFLSKIDFWTYPVSSLDTVEIRVEPASVQKFENFLSGADIHYKMKAGDMRLLLDAEKASSRAGGFDSKYHRLGEVQKRSV